MTSIRKGFKRKSNDIPQRRNGHQKTPGPAGLTPFVREQSKVPDFGAMTQPFGDVSGTSVDDMFKGLNGNLPQSLSSNFLDALNGALGGYGDLASTERTDMLIQYLLQLLTTSEQRDWDKSVLAEQRQYDNPTNQLARLMAAGISRDAAISLLSGSSGSGGSAALIGSGFGASAPSVSAPSGTTEIARNQMILGGVANIANTLVNLCSQGMQIAQAYQTFQFEKNQAYMSTQQVQSYDAVNNVNQQLQMLSDAGVLGDKKIEDYRSTTELTNHLKSIADQQPDVKKLLASDDYKRAVGTIYGRDYFNQVMNSRRSSRDAGKIADLAITQAELSNNLLSLNQESISAEIAKMRSETRLVDANIQLTMQKIAESQAQIEVLNANGEFVKVQTDAARLNYELTETGFPLLKESRLNELRLQAAKWRALYDPTDQMYYGLRAGTGDPLGSAITAWLQNPVNASDAAYLQSLHNGALAGFAEQHPTLWKLCSIFNDMGVFNAVKAGLDAGAIVTNVMP